MSELFDDLKRLAEMRDKGEITQSEFDKIKAELVAEMGKLHQATSQMRLLLPRKGRRFNHLSSLLRTDFALPQPLSSGGRPHE